MCVIRSGIPALLLRCCLFGTDHVVLLQDRMGDDIHDEAFLRPKRLWYCSSTTFQEGLRSIRSIYETDAHQNRLTTPQHSTYTLSLSG